MALKAKDKIPSYDVRQQGGGLRNDSSLITSQEAERCWDIGKWSGAGFPGGGQYYVEVPVEILSGAGGSFLMNEVREIVERHTALGVYPVIHAYGIDPEITDVSVGDGSVTLTWSHSKATVSYKVYQSNSRNGPWTAVSGTTPLAEDASGNSYTVAGLENNIPYYFFVAGGIETDGTWVNYCGQVVRPTAVEADVECSLKYVCAVPGLPRSSSHFSSEFTVV